MCVLAAVVVAHVTAILQILLQLSPLGAVVVKCAFFDQLGQLARIVLEHEGFVDEILVAGGVGQFFQRGELSISDLQYLGSQIAIHALDRERDLVDVLD